MKSLHVLFGIAVFLYMTSMQASYRSPVIALAKKTSQYMVQKFEHIKKNPLVSTEHMTFLESSTKMPQVCKGVTMYKNSHHHDHQAAKNSYVTQLAQTQAQQSIESQGFLNFSKNLNHATTNIIHNHTYNYGKKTWSENFFTWIRQGGQARSAGVGLVVGLFGGYGLHSLVHRTYDTKHA